jgi:hypothetical protein
MKKKVCFAFGEKGHIANRHLCISGRDSAAGGVIKGNKDGINPKVFFSIIFSCLE